MYKVEVEAVPFGVGCRKAMRFWFVHSGDVSLHDQIVTQVSLGILSGDLSAGE